MRVARPSRFRQMKFHGSLPRLGVPELALPHRMRKIGMLGPRK